MDNCLRQLRDGRLTHDSLSNLNHVFAICLSQIQLSLKPLGIKPLEDLIGQLAVLQMKIFKKSFKLGNVGL